MPGRETHRQTRTNFEGEFVSFDTLVVVQRSHRNPGLVGVKRPLTVVPFVVVPTHPIAAVEWG